jgi:mRNA interferase YafQ
MISEQEIIPAKYDDHILTGNWNGYRELHISSDWLLVYKYTDEGVIFIRTGSHSDIF